VSAILSIANMIRLLLPFIFWRLMVEAVAFSKTCAGKLGSVFGLRRPVVPLLSGYTRVWGRIAGTPCAATFGA